MGKVYDAIDDATARFVERQRMFFVATAPRADDGHVNVSPKGIDGTFAILAPKRVAYLDFVGSGVETIAHLRENGRITLMFTAFEGSPKTVRLYGTGRAILTGDPTFDEAAAPFAPLARVGPNARAVIVVDVERVAHSCGYGVPLYTFDGERTQLDAWAERKGPDGIRAYAREKNARSIDGLKGL
ncbi:MAG: pyridoxamine 5'-phosphate oxidase family protein [Deltaproteobacteria bacterium]